MKSRFLLSCVLLSAFAVVTFAGCGENKPTLALYNWTYYIPDEVIEAFTQETGIKVNAEFYDSNETMYAKLKAGNNHYDVVVPSGDYVSIMRKNGMLTELDRTKLPNFQNIDEKVLKLITFDAGNQFSVPYFMGASGVHVNTAFVKNYDESWSIFSRSDLASRMSMTNDMREVMGDALKYLGYSVNSVNPEQIEKAKRVILGWKKNLLKFDAETFGKDFAAQNVWVAQGYAEVVLKELEGSDSSFHAFFLPKEGGPMYMDSLVILKESKHQDEAYQFINYLLRPEVHAKIADAYYYPSLIPAADKFRKVEPPYRIDRLLNGNFEFKDDVGPALSLYTAAWNGILQGS